MSRYPDTKADTLPGCAGTPSSRNTDRTRRSMRWINTTGDGKQVAGADRITPGQVNTDAMMMQELGSFRDMKQVSHPSSLPLVFLSLCLSLRANLLVSFSPCLCPWCAGPLLPGQRSE